MSGYNDKSDSYLDKLPSETPVWERKHFKAGFWVILGLLSLSYIFFLLQPVVRMNFNFYRPENQETYSKIREGASIIISTGGDLDEIWKKKWFSHGNIFRMGEGYTLEIKGEKDVAKRAEYRVIRDNEVLEDLTIEFIHENHWNRGISKIEKSSGEIILDGKYIWKDSRLRDASLDEKELSESEHKKYIFEMRKYGEIVRMISRESQERRGDIKLGVLVFVVLFLGIMQIKHPKFLYELRYSWAVEDPEPTELYLLLNYIGGVVLILFSIFLAIGSIAPRILEFILS